MAAARNARWWLGAASTVSLLAACNQLLGIDEAEVDARLSQSGSENSVTSGGSGNRAGSEGVETGGASGSGGGANQSGAASQGGTAGSHSHVHGEAGGSEGGGDTGPGPTSGGSNQGGGTGARGGDAPGAGGDVAEGGGGGDDSQPADLCELYCDEMGTQCTGVAEQYRDRQQCLRLCRMFPEGTTGSPDENSVACRLKYAQKARYGLGTEVNVYCSQAGPSGDGRCGSVCEGFCTLMANVCTEESAGVYHFASDEECLTTCEALPPAGVSYSSSDPVISDGNHALCRLFHVTSAAMADAEEHCEHSLGLTLCEALPE